jgi:hypothetical protein
MRVWIAQRAWFARRINSNGEGIRERSAVIFEAAYFHDPAGF